MNVEERLHKARTHLLLDHPWFGSLVLKLTIEAGNTDTMSTNGTKLFFNESWVGERTDAELVAVLGHETMHCAMLHMYRGKGRDWELWNQATDYAINWLLAREGFQLPANVLLDNKYANMSAEQIYAYLESHPDEQPQPDAGKGTGDFQPAPEGSEEGEEESISADEWQIAAEQASAVSKRMGSMSGELDRSIKATHQSETDWRAVLWEWIQNVLPSDYSWTQPNRRYIAQGIYLPGVLKENMPHIGVTVDTSASVDAQMLREFGAELTAILHEARPEYIEVIYCDSSVKGQEIFSPDDAEVELHAKGGGGTRFQPAIDHFNEDPPVCMIYLTDLEASQPEEPDYPVLWAVPEWQTAQGWFGTTVRLVKER